MNITVSLETAKKLKEAGWDKECEFSYYNNPTTADGYILHWIGNDQRSWKNELNDRYPNEPDHFIEAPSLQEILEELPEKYILQKWHNTNNSKNQYFFTDEQDFFLQAFGDNPLPRHESPVEAAAELWLEIKKGE